MLLKKNILPGKTNFSKIFYYIFFILFFSLNSNSLESENTLEGSFVEINILDKLNSKNSNLILKVGEEEKFKNLLIKPLKCKNSKFDDNPEVTAYLQVRDVTYKENDKVFVFNGWTFSSSPSLKPFDHPLYDIWLTKCY